MIRNDGLGGRNGDPTKYENEQGLFIGAGNDRPLPHPARPVWPRAYAERLCRSRRPQHEAGPGASCQISSHHTSCMECHSLNHGEREPSTWRTRSRARCWGQKRPLGTRRGICFALRCGRVSDPNDFGKSEGAEKYKGGGGSKNREETRQLLGCRYGV